MVSDKYSKYSNGELIDMLGEKLAQSDRDNPIQDLADAMNDKSILNKRYLTIEEVSKLLRITQATFRSWINRKLVPFPIIKLGKKILVDEDDLKEHLASAKQFPKGKT